MPIYEYVSTEPGRSCPKCREPFEVIQGAGEKGPAICPACGGGIKKIISRCRAAVIEPAEAYQAADAAIREHEREGRFSHAAELADKVSERAGDPSLKGRALENYAKAGYSRDMLDRHGSGSQ
jgi:putative FmdB family regulatory protein